MIDELVSIIVPVYNVQNYLEQCISSICNQTYKNLEIILVNDGSTDNSGIICEKFAKSDSRIKLIAQENQGLTRARKAGVGQANGEYIGFIDSDDWIDPDMYQQLMERRDSFDLIISQWYREEEQRVRRAYNKIALGPYTTEDEMNFLLDHLVNASAPGGKMDFQSGIVANVWSKLYKAAIVKDVFEEVNEDLIYVEDVEFTYKYILRCKSILITDICGYHYRIRKASLAHAVRQDCAYLRNVCALYEALLPVFSCHPKHESLVPQLQYKFSVLLEKTPARMGFPLEAQNRNAVFPFLNLLDGKRIALYGAGKIGRNYVQQIRPFAICDLAAWVDENWRECQRAGENVSSIDTLMNIAFDYVIIAVSREAEAVSIRQKLYVLGIQKEKILWKEPMIL